MALPMSSPVPAEINNYVPGSVTEEQNFISDGPYTITSYTPERELHPGQEPVWQQSTDPIRHQYFNAVSVTMGETPTAVQQQLQTGAADMEWDTTVPPADVPGWSPARTRVRGRLLRWAHLPRVQHEEYRQWRRPAEAGRPRGAPVLRQQAPHHSSDRGPAINVASTRSCRRR